MVYNDKKKELKITQHDAQNRSYTISHNKFSDWSAERQRDSLPTKLLHKERYALQGSLNRQRSYNGAPIDWKVHDV